MNANPSRGFKRLETPSEIPDKASQTSLAAAGHARDLPHQQGAGTHDRVVQLDEMRRLAPPKAGSSFMSRNFPPLGALRAFEAASRHMSFVRAAEELNVTPAAVSHQIKQLEHWIGMKLFDRGARGVALSRAGQDYATRVRDVFDRLISTSAAVRAQKSRRIVQIRSQLSVAVAWILPRITAFNQSQGDIEVQLQGLPFDANPSKGGVDITIYHQRGDIEGYRQRVIFSGKYKLFAAPALIARNGVLAPSALLSQPLLHTVSTNAQLRAPTLQDWFAMSGTKAPEVLPGMQFNLEHLTAAACIAGAGYALLNDELALDAARAGSLVALPGPAIENSSPYTLMMKTVVKDEVRTVADWLMRDTAA
jgi:LysR family transcriptional regulator, glycine cleavage system transcriptional activator